MEGSWLSIVPCQCVISRERQTTAFLASLFGESSTSYSVSILKELGKIIVSMDNDGSPPPPPSKDVPSSGENPIREAASKAKAALKDRIGGSSENRPSVRILRKQVSPHAEAHGAGRDQELDPQFGTHDDPYDSSPKGGALNRFRNTVTSFFSEPDDDSYYHKRSKDEYDRETVDLLDVVGKCSKVVHNVLDDNLL